MEKQDNNKRRKVADTEGESANIVNKSPASKQQLSIRTYLDQTVVPALLQGMTALVKARPEDQDPLIWLGNWLIEHAKTKGSTVPSPAEKTTKKSKDKEKESTAVTVAMTSTTSGNHAPAATTTTTTLVPAPVAESSAMHIEKPANEEAAASHADST